MYPLPHKFSACPLHALPDLLYNAACEVAALGCGVPAEVLLPDVVGACSSAVHALWDVEGPDGRSMPTSINTLSVAPSGVGKGTSFSSFFGVFYTFETEQRLAATQAGEETETTNGLILQEVSYRALMEHLSGTNRCVTIQHEDGWSFLRSDLVSKYPDKATQVWSGGIPLRHKVHRIDLVANGGRCSIGFRIQPEVFFAYLRRTGNASYDQGLWPRSLAACYIPSRTADLRASVLVPRSNQGRDALAARLKELLSEADARMAAGITGRKVMKLGEKAQSFMRELQFRMKQWQLRDYSDVSAAAARAWENTLRLAAVFHVVCVGDGTIGLGSVERAWEIVEWSLTQHRLILEEVNQTKTNEAQWPRDATVRTKAPRPNQSALSLKACIEEVCCRRNTHWVSISDIEALTDLPPMKLTKAWAWLKFKREVVVQGVGARASVSINRYPNQGSL